jgi:hypothetical protein
MSIRELEEILFQEWKKGYQQFVPDGVVDERYYCQSSKKLMFILKEVNNQKEEWIPWDLREFLRQGGRWQTWDNITRWIEGIRNLPNEIAWRDIEKVGEPRRCNALRSVCAVNLKKAPGSSICDDKELASVANKDRSFIARQFSFYNPDLVICCGAETTRTFCSLMDLCDEHKWQKTTRGIDYYEFKPHQFIVSYVHPEARVSDSILYYGFIDAVREILSYKDNGLGLSSSE